MFRMGLATAPVEPGRRVVLAVRVVIAALRVEELVPGGDHRDPVRQQEEAAEVLRLPEPEGLDLTGDALGPLPAAVPAKVLRHAVGVALPVRLVVAAVVGSEVVQREPVVAGDEVDALAGPPRVS